MSNILINSADDRIAIGNLLQSDETRATVIHAIVHSVYGDEAYDWDPLTIVLELKQDFNVDACAPVMDKWCAIQVLMGSDAFFQRIDAFTSICNSFADGDPMFDAFNPATVEEIALALSEVGMNRDMLPFSHTIKAYTGLLLEKAGYPYGKFPPVFSEMFDKNPTSEDVRDGISVLSHNKNIGYLISNCITDMAKQFATVPDLRGVDKSIIDNGIEAALEGKKITPNAE